MGAKWGGLELKLGRGEQDEDEGEEEGRRWVLGERLGVNVRR